MSDRRKYVVVVERRMIEVVTDDISDGVLEKIEPKYLRIFSVHIAENCPQRWLEAAIHSVRSELRETIRYWMEVVLS